jgi:hypothetical protein
LALKDGRHVWCEQPVALTIEELSEVEAAWEALGMLPDDAASRAIAAELGAEPGHYVLATIHRPENTDDPKRPRVILDELGKLGLPVLLPLHPRTRAAVERHGLTEAQDRLQASPRPITGRSSGWPGTRASWSPTPAASRKNAPCSRSR